MNRRKRRWLAGHTINLLDAVINKEYDDARRMLGEIGSRCGDQGVYLVCTSMCSVLHAELFPEVPRGDGSLTGPVAGFRVWSESLSDEEAVQAGGPAVWSGRFFVAYLNGDTDTTVALFLSCLDDRDQAIDNVAALVGLTAMVVSGQGQVEKL